MADEFFTPCKSRGCYYRRDWIAQHASVVYSVRGMHPQLLRVGGDRPAPSPARRGFESHLLDVHNIARTSRW
eukprot:scaffold250987_cov32-Tisochrysis_lutea.AAC.4